MTHTLLKIGGSLLDLPDLAVRLLKLLDSEQIEQAVVVVGGGPAADLIRHYDKQFALTKQACHRLAIHAMALNANMLAELHSSFATICTPISLAEFTGRVAIIDPVQMLAFLEDESAESNLPASWDTTSDSIAAWICSRLNIRRLILLKSTGLLGDTPHRSVISQQVLNVQLLVDRKLVDSHFAEASRNIGTVDWCNLRSSARRFCVTSLR